MSYFPSGHDFDFDSQLNIKPLISLQRFLAVFHMTGSLNRNVLIKTWQMTQFEGKEAVKAVEMIIKMSRKKMEKVEVEFIKCWPWPFKGQDFLFNSESRYLCPYLTSHRTIHKHWNSNHTHIKLVLSWTHTQLSKHTTEYESGWVSVMMPQSETLSLLKVCTFCTSK